MTTVWLAYDDYQDLLSVHATRAGAQAAAENDCRRTSEDTQHKFLWSADVLYAVCSGGNERTGYFIDDWKVEA